MHNSTTAALPPHSLDLRTTPWFDTAMADMRWPAGPALPAGSSRLFPQPGLAMFHRQPQPPGLGG